MVEVTFSELNGRKGFNIEDSVFLAVKCQGRKWIFQLFDLFSDYKPLSYSVRLNDYQDLVDSRKAKIIRDMLRKHVKKDISEVLNQILLQLEIHEDDLLEPDIHKDDLLDIQLSEGFSRKDFPLSVERQIEAEVKRILEAENQLEALKPHLDNVICGEEANKLAILVLLMGSKYDDVRKKSIIILKGSEGGGKTTIAKNLCRFFKTKEVGRFSSHALDYTNLEGFEVLYLKELGSMDLEKQGVSTIKFLSMDDMGYTVEVTVRDSETGEFATKTYQIPAITVISTTTRLLLDRQFERRAWLFNIDESKEQTERIKKWKAEQKRQEDEKLLGLRKVTDYEFSMEVLRRFIQRVEPQEIIIPFRETLTEFLDSENLRIRADIDKIHAFIELYGLFNIKRLQRIDCSRVYAVTPEVAVEGLKLIEKPLSNMLSMMDERIKPLIEALKDMDFKAQDDITKSERERIAVRLGKSEKTIRSYFNYLETRGLVSSDNKRPKTYTLLYPIKQIEEKLSGVSAKFESANILIQKMREEAQKWLNSILEIGTPEDIHIQNNNIKTDDSNHSKINYAPSKQNEINISPELPISNNVISENEASLEKKASEDWQNEKLPIFQRDGLYQCPDCKKPVFFGSKEDLQIHIEKMHGSDKNDS